ncbi:DNA polymerase III subunit delta' [Streptococcus merionis]|uniref:DNA polymerase III subunit delta n=1 Tax=Streptococcus merionis TaxID=400065 RepID=A0A239SVB9_9STRE|nr:DNA polymerase III subunit delta' [Streptococcus merionis]SNU88768.1 DNA polymerase III subunit delta' [Streptococcus merionis]
MKLEILKRQQPKLFDEFQQILQAGKLAHAYLFTGAFASLDMAVMLAQASYCEAPLDSLPCQICRACRLIEADEFSDVKRLTPTNNIIKTDLVREVMQDFVQSGFETDHQLLIIEGADKMHVNAANSLLKFIEEPQSKVNIFLLTDQETAVLPTIKSRCQIFHFPKNQALMQEELEAAGLLKTQAQLLSDLCPTLDQALALGQNSHFMETLSVAETWIERYLAGDAMAYLTTAKLSSLPSDKAEQGQLFDLLTLLLAKAMPTKKAQEGLSQLLEVRLMWQANVSLQNALEYMILTA